MSPNPVPTSRTIAFLLAAVAIVGARAGAQPPAYAYYPEVMQATTQNLIMIQNMERSFALSIQSAERARGSSSSSSSSKKSPKSASPAARTDDEAGSTSLTFKRDPAVTVRVQQRFVAPLEARAPGAGKRVTDGTLQEEFDDLLSSYGYSGRNLADVVTAYLVMSWELVNDGDASKNRSGIAAVRQNVARSLSHSRLSETERQESAETLTYTIMFAVAARNGYRRSGDQAGLTTLKSQIRDVVRKGNGIDLARYRLTGDGFQPA